MNSVMSSVAAPGGGQQTAASIGGGVGGPVKSRVYTIDDILGRRSGEPVLPSVAGQLT